MDQHPSQGGVEILQVISCYIETSVGLMGHQACMQIITLFFYFTLFMSCNHHDKYRVTLTEAQYLPHVIMFAIYKCRSLPSGLFSCDQRCLSIHHKTQKRVVRTVSCYKEERIQLLAGPSKTFPDKRVITVHNCVGNEVQLHVCNTEKNIELEP